MYDFFYYEDCIKVVFSGKIDFSDFNNAIRFLLEIQNNNNNYDKNIEIIYSEPTDMYVDGCSKLVEKATVYFFFKKDELYYSSLKKMYKAEAITFNCIKELIIFTNNSLIKNKRDKTISERILKERYDSTTWSNLTCADFEPNCRFGNIVVNIFPDHVYVDLENAFKNKLNYDLTFYKDYNRSYRIKGYSFTVRTELGEDGIFRAYYTTIDLSSKVVRKYILLNPQITISGYNKF